MQDATSVTKFAKFGDRPDFSGFDRSDWEMRSNERHRVDAEKHRMAKKPTDAKSISSATGADYSVLYEFLYYDPIRFSLIDPVHNLLLGTKGSEYLAQGWNDWCKKNSKIYKTV